MNLNKYLKITIVFTLFVIFSLSANQLEDPVTKAYNQEKNIILRTPPPHAQGYFVSELLTRLYKSSATK